MSATIFNTQTLTCQGFVYKWTHTPTGEYYIGIHKGNPDDGYIGSGTLFRQRFNETYGNNWQREILLQGNYYDKCIKLEAKLVNRSTLEDPLCLNRNVGGNAGKRIKDRKEKPVQGKPNTKSYLNKSSYRVKPQTVVVRGKVFNTRMEAIKHFNIGFEELDNMLREQGWEDSCAYSLLNNW